MNFLNEEKKFQATVKAVLLKLVVELLKENER